MDLCHHGDVIVREATGTDLPHLWATFHQMSGECAFFPIDETKVQSVLDEATSGTRARIGVIDGGDHICGFVGLAQAQLWYTSQWHVAEVWNYVRPQCRTAKKADALLHFARAYADEVDLQLFIAIASTERVPAKVRLYRRFFGDPVGSLFVYGKETRGG